MLKYFIPRHSQHNIDSHDFCRITGNILGTRCDAKQQALIQHPTAPPGSEISPSFWNLCDSTLRHLRSTVSQLNIVNLRIEYAPFRKEQNKSQCQTLSSF